MVARGPGQERQRGSRPASGPGTSSRRSRWRPGRGRRWRRTREGRAPPRSGRRGRGGSFPNAVGLNVSIASGRTAGSSDASSFRIAEPWAHIGYGTSGWAGIARPPWSWIASMDQRRLLSAGTGRSRNSPRRCPPRVEISSPTTIATPRPRSAAISRAASAASIRSWSAIAMTSRNPSASTRSRTSTTDAVPSEAQVWMCRSARPSRSTGSAIMPAPAAHRDRDDRARARVHGRDQARRRRRAHPGRGPARSDGRRPTIARGVGDDRLERHRRSPP